MKRVYNEINPLLSYRIGEASKLLGISACTLRKDARGGVIDYLLSPKGHMLFRGVALINYRTYCL